MCFDLFPSTLAVVSVFEFFVNNNKVTATYINDVAGLAIQLELFDKRVHLILLYGCEIWALQI